MRHMRSLPLHRARSWDSCQLQRVYSQQIGRLARSAAAARRSPEPAAELQMLQDGFGHDLLGEVVNAQPAQGK